MTTWNDFLKSLADELNRPTAAQRRTSSVKLTDGTWARFYGVDAMKDASDCRLRQEESKARKAAAAAADAAYRR